MTSDLSYFTVKRFGVEPTYLDYPDDLSVDSGQDRASLEGDVEGAFSIRGVTRSFYQDFGGIFREDLQDAVHGSESPKKNLNAYTRTVVSRVLFLLLIKKKKQLDGDVDYIRNKYEGVAEDPNMYVYEDFFEPLFFEALLKEGATESDALDRIPFLSDELFECEDIEKDVKIDGIFLDKLLSPEKNNSGSLEGLLQRYKISLRKSNPSERELVVDPEFVGRIFEMFMQKGDRVDLGAFYTPKPVTPYMTKDALKQHLPGQTDITSEETVSLVTDHVIPEPPSDSWTETTDETFRPAAVLDPAVNSDALIIVMPGELVTVSEALNSSRGNDRSRFQPRKEFIADALYGVDIDAAGVGMCKFRV